MPTPKPGAAPFHDGETAVHELYGIRERIEQVGRAMMRSAMPAQHRDFFRTLPIVIVGSLDGDGRPWASLLIGRRGFVEAPDEHTLRVAAIASPRDPLAANLAVGSALGLLGIELATRRRNRLNGTVAGRDADSFTVHVDQSFGNCPQYIQARDVAWGETPSATPGEVEAFEGVLPEAAARLVQSSDTAFLASASSAAPKGGGAEGVDVSHRGGRPGFVRVASSADGRSSVLTIPDFRGNFLFNTIGNLVRHPMAGLLFVDFARGDLLQLTGSTEIVWEGPEVESFAGAQRLVKFTLAKGVSHPGALAARWSNPEFASQLADTGSWPDAKA